MVFRFIGFAKYGAKEVSSANNIRVEANNELDAQIKMVKRLKSLLGVPAERMFDTSRVSVERVFTDLEIRQQQVEMQKEQERIWLLSDDLIDLFIKYNVVVSTSIDGPKEINDYQAKQAALLAKLAKKNETVETASSEESTTEETPKKTTTKKKKTTKKTTEEVVETDNAVE